MNENLGMGVMLGILGGNEETVKAVQSSLNKTIEQVFLDDEETLRIVFNDKTTLLLSDQSQSCCEHRHMSTDDDLSYYKNTPLLDIELSPGESKDEDDYGNVHDTQFLKVTTGLGTFTMVNHNEHNGYYGGFWIVATTGVVE